MTTINDGQPKCYLGPRDLEGVDEHAIEVWGESYTPRIKPGEMVFVNPGEPFSSGHDVVVIMNDGSAVVGEYAGREGDTLRLRKLNPVSVEEYPARDVQSVQRIVGVQIIGNKYHEP